MLYKHGDEGPKKSKESPKEERAQRDKEYKSDVSRYANVLGGK